MPDQNRTSDPPPATERSFRFAFADRHRLPATLFGITKRSALVSVTRDELVCAFGPWSVRTALANVRAVSLTGPYAWVRTVGPARLSLRDRGITMATNDERGVFVEFHRPVGGIDPLGLVRHPNLTVTVADCMGLLAALS